VRKLVEWLTAFNIAAAIILFFLMLQLASAA
jgi:hypothetical protein